MLDQLNARISCKPFTALYLPCTLWNIIYSTSSSWKILNHFFRFVENLYCEFPNVENSSCTFHFVKKYHKVVTILQTLLAFSPTIFFYSFNYGSFVSIFSAFHIVYETFYPTFFAHCGTYIILLLVLWKILNYSFCIVESLYCNFQDVENLECTFHIVENMTGWFPHCGNYERFFHKFILTF